MGQHLNVLNLQADQIWSTQRSLLGSRIGATERIIVVASRP